MAGRAQRAGESLLLGRPSKFSAARRELDPRNGRCMSFKHDLHPPQRWPWMSYVPQQPRLCFFLGGDVHVVRCMRSIIYIADRHDMSGTTCRGNLRPNGSKSGERLPKKSIEDGGSLRAGHRRFLRLPPNDVKIDMFWLEP